MTAQGGPEPVTPLGGLLQMTYYNRSFDTERRSSKGTETSRRTYLGGLAASHSLPKESGPCPVLSSGTDEDSNRGPVAAGADAGGLATFLASASSTPAGSPPPAPSHVVCTASACRDLAQVVLSHCTAHRAAHRKGLRSAGTPRRSLSDPE
eukprot:CAMPEP_0204329048 /NCGR_PEP_ID=MMETSP0469-20131031/13860_1 /ASSEMBLY_ACC=CAM_ASM_000384 /TAXON_ID=2969 /ORGANISM="Oxyrrhis marina" /LENGTH=150 /DNA_ID=CAMNT_0051311577 /DNA_START=20 /DNA_END=473 /DNA_ORIENTATION=+